MTADLPTTGDEFTLVNIIVQRTHVGRERTRRTL